MSKMCKCPYIVCPYRDNCRACIAHNIEDGTLPHCMEEIGQNLGAKINQRVPRTMVMPDYEAMSRECANEIKECLDYKPDSLLCIHAGSTVVRTCEILKEMQDKGEIDFSKAKFIALDEWLDLEDESENRFSFLKKHLYEPLGIKPEQIYQFNTHAEDLQEECKRIDGIIAENGVIDLMLVGLGMNGRIGFNEPDEDFVDYTKVVELSETTKEEAQKYFSKETELKRGITLGIHHMFESYHVILQVSGESKKDIVEEMYHTQPIYRLPGTVMILLAGGEVIMDEAAAVGIKDLVK